MIRERVLRFSVPDHEALGRIATAPLPLGLRDLGADLDFFRIVYFDTRAADLERKGASVRLRIRPDETQVLQVEIDVPAADEPGVVRRYAEAEVPSLPPAELFTGTSEPARMIRALVDPSHLRPAFELETVRHLRTGAPEENPLAKIGFAFDAITVRKGSASGELQELEVTIPAGAGGDYEGLVEDVERAYGVHLTLADTVARARRLLDHLLLDRLEQDVRAAREVAVVAYQQGRVALARDGNELRIPTGHGSGQDACRRVLRNVFGKAYARIRLLGTSAGMEAVPGLEIWLAEGLTHNDGGCDWLPLDDVLERVGTPRLRDARTLVALHTIARSDLAVRPADGDAPTGSRTPAYPIFERAVSRVKVDAMLQEPASEKVAPELLLNTELSRLSFDERILFMAEDERTPLLERVRFLSMFGTRLDDFFMTRVAEFKQELAMGSTEKTADGLTAGEQLEVVRIRARQVARRAYRLLGDGLFPALEATGIRVLDWSQLDEDDREHLRQNFTARVEAVTTPVIADPTHPFPHIRNLRPAIAAALRLPESRDEHFVAIELPSGLPRFVPLPDGRRFVPLEEVILASLPKLYPGLELVQANTFRVTRSGVIDLDDEPAGGVLTAIEEEIERRPFGEVVRLEVQSTMPSAVRDRLLHELQFERPDVETGLSVADVHVVDGLVDLAALRELAALEVPDKPGLHFEPLQHTNPLAAERPVLDQIAEEDVLVRFPEDSFQDTLERFMAEAAEDPDVVAMKITLYRTNPESRLVRALADARRQGKDAFALVELKASFDERRNIEWARSLQSAGIHVVFSPSNIKVHAKIALVVRREESGLRRYVYIGTGNLNAATARAYTDAGLLSARPELGEEVNAVFNLLTGYSGDRTFEHLFVSPFTMRSRFLSLIEREIQHAHAGRGGRIRLQMNGLADRRLIGALYRASHAGVQIDMAVREICSLRPGVPGLSENIRVVSLLGRFLQHARIFCFHNAGQPEYYLGSADWRPRNLSKRVEVATPIVKPAHCATLDEMLDGILHHPDAWELTGDGTLARGTDLVAI